MSSPNDGYPSIAIAADAVEFASSRFGKHYLARLEASRQRHLDLAMNSELTDSFRAHAATKAATVQSEIDYFATSQSVMANPTLVAKLRAKLSKKEDPKPIV